jgi:hypothetical protein
LAPITVDLLALSLISTYDLSSIFDAYHAASCLLNDPEQTIVSIDEVYDKVKNLKRMDPETALGQIGKESGTRSRKMSE